MLLFHLRTASRVVSALLSFPFSVSAFTSRRASICNGYAQLCDRSYGNISFVGAHDSYAVGSTNSAANQDYDVTQQLKDGIRLLQNQAHSAQDGIHLCHTDCLLYDAGLLSSYLSKVKSWMDENPNDVVTILIVNINNLPASQYAQAVESAGLKDLVFAPTSPTLGASSWPSLGSMIDAGKRLVLFLDNGATDNSIPYLIPEFGNMWETAFDVTDPSFSCAVNRSQGDTSQQMYVINHFLDTNMQIFGTTSLVPDKAALNTTNSASGFGSLGQQTLDCIAQYGKAPNFMLVDFYNYGQGSVFDVAASLNGVPAPTIAIAPPIIATGTAASPSQTARGTSKAVSRMVLIFGALIGMTRSSRVSAF